MVLARAHQPPQRRPMDHMCYHVETIKDDKGDQPSGGETTWANTGGSRSDRQADAFTQPRNDDALPSYSFLNVGADYYS